MEREEKNYKCSYSPTPAAQFAGLRRAGEVEFVIIARERGAITKGHSSPECYTKGKRSGHEATIMIFTLPGICTLLFPFHSLLFHHQITDEMSSHS